MSDPSAPDRSQELFRAHPRTFHENRYVYPVLSRRSGGISLGVNLTLDKVCNFDCVYCQVDRSAMGEKEFLELGRLETELDATLELAVSGRLYEDARFCQTPPHLRRLNDIALSGDGEPTTYHNFDDVARVCAEARRRRGLDDLKLILITNASMFHRPRVERGLEIFDGSNGEIWAKLDAGTEPYYRLVARSAIPFQRILDNLLLAARRRPIVIQSLFMRIQGDAPSQVEQQAFCERLKGILAGGGRIKLVQIHTIARPPAESWVGPLAIAELEALAGLVRARTGLPVAVFS